MTESIEDADNSLEELERAGRRKKRLGIVLGVIIGVPLVCVAALFLADVIYPGVGQHVRGVLGGEHDVFGERVYEPPHAVSAEALAEVDLERVHAELLPSWLARHSHDQAGQPSERTLASHEALLEAVESDANLHELFAEMGELLHSEEAAEEADRIVYLAWAFNEYLRQMDQPYHMESNLVFRDRGPMLYSKNYALADEVGFSVGGDGYTGVLANRIDRTNVVENYLCRSTESDEPPLWIIDTSAREAAEKIWPMLDAHSDAELGAVDSAFAPKIRAEAERVLDADHLGLLEETAPIRQRLLGVVDAINERACEDFRFTFKPTFGYESGRLLRLKRRAAQARGSSCPPITEDELATLLETSHKLEARKDELTPAMEALTAWAARPRLVHEVRHAADDARRVLPNTPIPCPGCPEDVGDESREELSAYLSGVAASGAPMVGLHRACHVYETTRTFHKIALEPLVERLTDGGCARGPVDELEEAARRARVELFEPAEDVETVGEWPERLPITQ